MTPKIDTASQAQPASTSVADDARRQRQALHDLLELSSRCEQTERSIAERDRHSSEAICRRHDRLAAYIQQRHAWLRASLEAVHAQSLRQIVDSGASNLQELKQQHETKLEQIRDEAARQDETLRAKLNESIWLAESLYEGTQVKIKQDLVELDERHSVDRESLRALVERVNARLQWHRQTWTIDAVEVQVDPVEPADPAGTFEASCSDANHRLEGLRNLMIPMLLGGWTPFLGLLGHTLIAAFILFWIARGKPVDQALWVWAIGAGIFAAAVGPGWFLIRWLAKRQLRTACIPIRRSLLDSERALQARRRQDRRQAEAALAKAKQNQNRSTEKARQKFEPAISGTQTQADAELKTTGAEHEKLQQRMEQEHRAQCFAFERDAEQASSRLNEKYERLASTADQRRAGRMSDHTASYNLERKSLQNEWDEGARGIADLVVQSRKLNHLLGRPWESEAWKDWHPPETHGPLVAVGRLEVDMRGMTGADRGGGRYQVQVPANFSVPALLSIPDRASVLIHTDREGRDTAVAMLRSIMLRLQCTLPPSRVRFTLIDPVGLGQSFAGFMHLADYDENLIGARIWSEPEHIEQRLCDLTQHMENVIQKYLRNEFDSIDRYNEQAGELAEPYRFVVIADLPSNLTADSMQRLQSIIHSGPRCGVFTLMVRDAWQPMPPGAEEPDMRGRAMVLRQTGEHCAWDDEVYGRFALQTDPPPPERFLTATLKRIGERARAAAQIQVPFATIRPPEGRLWTDDSAAGLSVPVGRRGATRLQPVALGHGVAQHVLIAGKTGSGKSTLLHVLITNLAMWYGPDQIEFYLIDFKKGVEFKCYARHPLPHARAIAIESDREFGVSVLQRIDEQMQRRGELFRDANVQDLRGCRAARPDLKLPRVLLLIDEFQELFTQDDRLAQQAALLLDRLVRQGRAFGVHVVLGSQTLGGTTGLPRGTMGQMAVRIALQCGEADSQLILNDDNTAAKLLSRPGEAIYNDAGGLIEGNSPFQVAWLPDDVRDLHLDMVQAYAAGQNAVTEPAVVFEGNAPADIAANRQLAKLADAGLPNRPPPKPLAWLGAPVAIKAPTAAAFARRSGANLLIVGQQDQLSMQIMTAALLSLMSQHPANGASFYILDGSLADSPRSAHLRRLTELSAHECDLVSWRQVEPTIGELTEQVRSRLDEDPGSRPTIYLLVHGLQRFRMLRRAEDDFGFAASEEEAPARPDRQFAELLREGPAVGLHTLVWCDSLASLERTIDRATLREFDHRVLFQVSADDSANLIDTPEANQLGLYRAILYSEEQGMLEKFRPYALPDEAWLEDFAAKLARR